MDVIAIGVYYAKGLIVTSGLYVLFLVLATVGGFAWYRDYAKQNKLK
jgi:nicotinamide mononucleotide transporter